MTSLLDKSTSVPLVKSFHPCIRHSAQAIAWESADCAENDPYPVGTGGRGVSKKRNPYRLLYPCPSWRIKHHISHPHIKCAIQVSLGKGKPACLNYLTREYTLAVKDSINRKKQHLTFDCGTTPFAQKKFNRGLAIKRLTLTHKVRFRAHPEKPISESTKFANRQAIYNRVFTGNGQFPTKQLDFVSPHSFQGQPSCFQCTYPVNPKIAEHSHEYSNLPTVSWQRPYQRNAITLQRVRLGNSSVWTPTSRPNFTSFQSQEYIL